MELIIRNSETCAQKYALIRNQGDIWNETFVWFDEFKLKPSDRPNVLNDVELYRDGVMISCIFPETILMEC